MNDYYGIPQHTIGLENTYIGSGRILNQLRDYLRGLKEELEDKWDDTVILLVLTNHFFLTAPPEELLSSFSKFSTDVLFAARRAAPEERPFFLLSSGYNTISGSALISKAIALKALVTAREPAELKAASSERLEDTYTLSFLSEVGKRWIRRPLVYTADLDYNCELFQSLLGSASEISMISQILLNYRRATTPLAVVGEWDLRPILRYFSDRSSAFRVHEFSRYASVPLPLTSDGEYPTVTVSVVVSMESGFTKYLLQSISALSYPKERISFLLAYTSSSLNMASQDELRNWITSDSAEYLHFEHHQVSDVIAAKQAAMKAALARGTHFFLNLHPLSLATLLLWGMEEGNTRTTPAVLWLYLQACSPS